MRVLILAESANPEWQSLPLEGWSYSTALAQFVDIHLVTRPRNRAAFLRAGRVEGRDFSIADTARIDQLTDRVAFFLRGHENKGLTTQVACSLPAYIAFEHLVWQQFGQAIANGEFDLVHRLTPTSAPVPSPIAPRCRRAGIPFILGPLNGGLPWPPGFDSVRRREGEWLSYARGLHRLFPGYWITREASSAIIIGSRGSFDDIPRRYHRKCVYIPSNGIDLRRFPEPRQRRPNRPLRAVFLGRLVPYKGADMAVAAAADFIRSGLLELDIIGDGPERPHLESLARKYGLQQGLSFAGSVALDEVHRKLAGGDIFLFPSIREFGGAVVLEAMVMGLLPIVVDYGGPGEHVDAASGFAVPLGSREQIIARIQNVLRDLTENPSRLERMSRNARQRVTELYPWEVKARQTIEVYRWVLGRRTKKPDFGVPLSYAKARIFSDVDERTPAVDGLPEPS